MTKSKSYFEYEKTNSVGEENMYTALYRAYRPEVFDDMLGQEHIVKIIKNQLLTGSVSHAYLFCGTRGTGKTSTARLLAKGVNCLAEEGNRPCGVCENCKAIKDGVFMDVIEIDAASNNGVENIRELRESVKYPPVIGRKKVYIIDEVHMLSTGAFNALLKTLEEPPENVMFILATTEPQKLPATILSRCMRLDFKRVPERILAQGMEKICKDKGIEIESGAIKLIATNADGSVRDGLSILDQCISAGQKVITRNDVLEFIGTVGEEVFMEMTSFVKYKNTSEALLLLEKVLADGKDVRQFMKDWLAHYRSLLIIKFIKNPEDLLNMSCENVDRMREQSDRLDLNEINDAILGLAGIISEAKWSTQPRILLELGIVKMSSGLISAPMGMTRETENSGQVQSQFMESAIPKDMAVPTNNLVKDNITQAGKVKNATSGNIDLEELWHAIFEDGEASKASFNLIRTGTRLVELGNQNIIVEAKNDIVKGYVETNIKVLEDIVEQHTGIKRKLVCVTGKKDNDEKSAEDILKEAESKLGISITMVD